MYPEYHQACTLPSLSREQSTQPSTPHQGALASQCLLLRQGPENIRNVFLDQTGTFIIRSSVGGYVHLS